MKHFALSEFACPCCGKNEMDCSFLVRLDKAREYSKCSYTINSGYRCDKHNRIIGGRVNSSHLFGLAADIRAITSRRRFKILEGLILAGFDRIGIYKKFIRVDSDESKEKEIIWLG